MQPQQLQMFMTPSEVANLRANDFDDEPVESPSHMAERMQEYNDQEYGSNQPYRSDTENSWDYLYRMREAVDDKGGIEAPIHVMDDDKGDVLLDGHHRATVAMMRDSLVPVIHHAGSDAPKNQYYPDSWQKRRAAFESAFLGPTYTPYGEL